MQFREKHKYNIRLRMHFYLLSVEDIMLLLLALKIMLKEYLFLELIKRIGFLLIKEEGL